MELNTHSFDPNAGVVFVEPECQSSYMRGFPPAKEKLINGFSLDWILDPEQSRWSMMNMSKILHVGNVSRGSHPINYLPRHDQPLLGEEVIDIDGSSAELKDFLKLCEVDGFVVLKDGAICVEAYYNGYRPEMRHEMMSVTKSLVGTLVGVLIEQGVLATNVTLADYIPELAETGWGDATLRQVLDMTTGARWIEDISNDKAHIIQATAAVGMQHARSDYLYANGFELICSVAGKDYDHGLKYSYCSGTSEVLGWLVSKVCGKNWQEVFSEKIWSRLGAEHDAMVLVDTTGQGAAHAGFNCTLRDMARFAAMMAAEGYFNGRQIVPGAWIKNIYQGDEQVRRAWKNSLESQEYHDAIFYRGQFRVVSSEKGIFFGLGAKGQMVYINVAENLVGVFQSTIAGVDEESDKIIRARQLGVMQQIGEMLA